MLLFFSCLLVCSLAQLRDPQNRKIVAIIATNDIHGYALPLNLTRSDTKQTYTQGGLATLAALIKTVKEEYPGNSLYFDSGDQFQGGFESSPALAGGKIINAFMDYTKVDGAAIGNHDFDNGYDFLEDYLGSRKTVNLVANLHDKEGNAKVLPKQQLSKLYTLANGITIGAIGLTTKFTPARSPGWTLGDRKISNIQFSSYVDIVKTESAKLRAEGAHAILLVSHVGDYCHISSPSYGIWSNQSRLPDQCMKEGEIHQLLDALPEGTIDGVLQGHYHQIVHSFIRGVPLVGNQQGGKYFNILYLQFEDNKLVESLIQGPIPVCQKVFKNTMQCEYLHTQDELSKAGVLTHWKFHDVPVNPDLKMEMIMRELLEKKIEPFLEVVCQNEKYLFTKFHQETEFNNLLGFAVIEAAPEVDLALLTPSLLREKFYPGPIRKLDLFNFHPFNSPFVIFTVTGAVFIEALKYLQTLQDAFNFSNELSQTLWITKDQARKGLTSVKWSNGSQIDPKAVITGVMHNFTLNSVENKFEFKRGRTFGNVRDVFESYLRKIKVISSDWLLINPQNPKLIVQIVNEGPSSLS